MIPVHVLRKAGLTDTQIVRVIEAYREDRREYERIKKQKQRARLSPLSPGTGGDSGGHGGPLLREERKKEEVSLPLTEVTNVTSVRGRRAQRSAPDWLATWEPNQQHFEIGELERQLDAQTVNKWAESYRDWNRNAKRPHNDPDAGFRNWIRQQRLGGQHNGNGQKRESLDEQIKRLADECRTREAELGLGLPQSAFDVRGRRSSR